MLRKAFSYIQIWHAVALLVMVLDQISKHLVQRILTYGDTQTITAFFDIVHVHNSGVAFGILANMGGRVEADIFECSGGVCLRSGAVFIATIS